jgi:hypothetical protein
MTKLIKAKAALDKAAARLDKDKSEEALRSLRARVKVSLDASNLMVSMVVHAKGVATGKPEVHVCMDDSLSGNMRLSFVLGDYPTINVEGVTTHDGFGFGGLAYLFKLIATLLDEGAFDGLPTAPPFSPAGRHVIYGQDR